MDRSIGRFSRRGKRRLGMYGSVQDQQGLNIRNRTAQCRVRSIGTEYPQSDGSSRVRSIRTEYAQPN